MKKRVSKKKAIEKLTTDLDKMKMRIKQKEKRRRKNRKRTRKINKIRKTRKRRVKKHKKITKKLGGSCSTQGAVVSVGHGHIYGPIGRKQEPGRVGAAAVHNDYAAALVHDQLNKNTNKKEDIFADIRDKNRDSQFNNQSFFVRKASDFLRSRLQPNHFQHYGSYGDIFETDGGKWEIF